MKEWIEYAAVWVILKGLGVLPRPMARSLCRGSNAHFLCATAWIKENRRGESAHCLSDWTDAQRETVVRGMLRNLAWMAAEFARFPKYSKENIEQNVVLDGHENFLEGQRRGKGVLYLTGPHRCVGVVVFCACTLRISPALHGPAELTTGESTRS